MVQSGQFSRGLLRGDLSDRDRRELERLIEGCEARLRGVHPTDAGAADLRRSTSENTQEAEASPSGEADREPDPEALDGRLWKLLRSCGDSEHTTELRQTVTALVHEMLQPLTAISNYVAACHHLLSQDADEQLASALMRIAGQIDRALRIAERMRENVE